MQAKKEGAVWKGTTCLERAWESQELSLEVPYPFSPNVSVCALRWSARAEWVQLPGGGRESMPGEWAWQGHG